MADDWAPARIDVYRGGAPAKPGADGWGVASTAPATSALSPAPTASPSTGGWIAKALEPITSYPATYSRMNKEAREQMSEGVSDIGGGHPFKGALKTAGGAAGYLTSPITAGLHTVVGKPLEENVGIPHEYSEFAAGLALPVYGMTGTSAARSAASNVEKLLSPETVDANARAAAAGIREVTGTAARETAKTGAALSPPRAFKFEPAARKVNELSDPERMDFISYVEGRSKQPIAKAGPEKIDWAAVQYKGKTYLGQTHVDAIEQAVKDTGKTFDEIADEFAAMKDGGKSSGGFYTSGGRYVTRNEAEELLKKQPSGTQQTSIPRMNAEGLHADRIRLGHGKTDQEFFLEGIDPKSKPRIAGQVVMDDPVLQDLADNMRDAFKQREMRIAALPAHQQTAFIEDYITHMWKDPDKARAAFAAQKGAGGGAGKQGSGASLSKRTVPTYADGIAQGLEPLTTDPIEITMRYVTSMDKFIGSQELLETGKNTGMIKWGRPRVMGGSGKPDSFIEPFPGWKPLTGRGVTRPDGNQLYAPEGYARVYNNWLSRGAHANEDWGKVYDTARRAFNVITGAELSLSGYHLLTVSKAALDNAFSQSLYLLRSGKPVEAIKQAARGTVAPYRYARTGKEVKDVYLGLSQGSRELEKVVDNLEKAGGRAVGKEHAPEYEFSGKGSYVTALKRGAWKGQRIADRAEFMGSPLGAAKVAFRNIGRIMDTVAAPLFEQYIPSVKNGAFRENLSNWIKVNPIASEEDTLNAARQIWDDIDDRFGEMVQDNMFMHKGVKQIGMLSLRSWSWTVGQDVRMLGGAARDVFRAPFKGPGPRASPGPHDTAWTSKMDMAIAMPIVYGTLAMIYQGLKTKEPPADTHDLAAPRTGGTDPITGAPERLVMPGVEAKDVAGAYMHPTQEATGKISTSLKVLFDLWNNEDWRGDPIRSRAEDAPPWLQQYWEYAAQNLGPISLRTFAKGKKLGSNLNTLERLLGVREAPAYLTDKEAYDDMMKGIEAGKYRKKLKHDERQRGLYEDE